MRDKDANTAWATASGDGVLEERRVYCQNWRGDVSALITDTGKMVEWVKYSAYGVAFGLPAGDTDSNGTWDATDSAAITGSLDPRKDENLDGTVSAADITQANAITGGYQTLGRTVLSSNSVASRKGYAGYENDGGVGDQYHVRHRAYRAALGRWGQRDPVGYLDGISLYEYVGSRATIVVDPLGLKGIGVGIGQPCIETGSATIIVLGMTGCEKEYEYKCVRDDSTDVNNPKVKACKQKCNDDPKALGTTWCEGDKTACCVCANRIMEQAKDDWSGSRILRECVDTHEACHLGQGCPIPPKDSAENACQEVPCYEEELACLQSKISRCPQGEKGATCRAAVSLRIDGVKDLIEEMKTKCGKKNPAFSDPVQGGPAVPDETVTSSVHRCKSGCER
jgi:RHS repeat-associated protein